MCSIVCNASFLTDEALAAASFKHGDILLFNDLELAPLAAWTMYAFYRDGDTVDSLRDFNMHQAGLINGWPNASQLRPFIIPVSITRTFADAHKAYASAIKTLNDNGYEVELRLQADDRWLRSTFCDELSASELEIVARWLHLTVNFAHDRRPRISNADFGTAADSYRHTSLAEVRYEEQLERREQAVVAAQPAWLMVLDVKTLIADYVVMCKTTKAAVLIFRQPKARQVQINIGADVDWNFWAFRKPNALLREWRGCLVRQFMQQRGPRRVTHKYKYYYVSMFGPVEHYKRATLLAHARALCPFTVLGAVAGIEPVGVFDLESGALGGTRYTPVSHQAIDMAFGSRQFTVYGPSRFAQWWGLHAQLLDYVIALEPLHLSDYVMLWLLEHVGLVHAPALQRLQLISSVLASMRRVRARRAVRRNPKRLARASHSNSGAALLTDAGDSEDSDY